MIEECAQVILTKIITPLNFPVDHAYIQAGERCGDFGDFQGLAPCWPNTDVPGLVGFEVRIGFRIPKGVSGRDEVSKVKIFFEKMKHQFPGWGSAFKHWRKNYVPLEFVVIQETRTQRNLMCICEVYLVLKAQVLKYFQRKDVRRWLSSSDGYANPVRLCKLYVENRKPLEDAHTLKLILRNSTSFNYLPTQPMLVSKDEEIPSPRDLQLEFQSYLSLTLEGLLSTRDHAPLDREAVIKEQRAQGGGAAASAAARSAKRSKPPQPPPTTPAAKAMAKARACNNASGGYTAMVTTKQLQGMGNSVSAGTFFVQMMAQFIRRPDFRQWEPDPELFKAILDSMLDRIQSDGGGRQANKLFQTVILQHCIPIRKDELERGVAFRDLSEECATVINDHAISINEVKSQKNSNYPYENALWDVLTGAYLRMCALQPMACAQAGNAWQQLLIVYKNTLAPALEGMKKYAAQPVRPPLPAPAELLQEVLANFSPPQIKESSLDGEGTNAAYFLEVTGAIMGYLYKRIKLSPPSVMQVLHHYLHLKTTLEPAKAGFVTLNLVVACCNAANNEDYLRFMSEAYVQGVASPDYRSPVFFHTDIWNSSSRLFAEMTPPDEHLNCVTSDKAIKDAKKQARAAKKKEKSAKSAGAPAAAPKPSVFIGAIRERRKNVPYKPDLDPSLPQMKRTWMDGTKRRATKKWVVLQHTPTCDLGDGVVLDNPPPPDPANAPSSSKRREKSKKRVAVRDGPSAPSRKKPAASSAIDTESDSAEESALPSVASAPRAEGKRKVKAPSFRD